MYNDSNAYNDIYENDNSRYEEFEPEAGPDERIQLQIAKEQQLIDELEADAAGQLFDDDGDGSGEEQLERKLLRRELQAQALARLEDAARTPEDFENVIACLKGQGLVQIQRNKSSG